MYISQIDKTERLNTLRVVLTFRERSTSFLQGRTERRIMFYLHKRSEFKMYVTFYNVKIDLIQQFFAGIVEYHQENMISPVITTVKVESIIKSIAYVHPEDEYVITSLYYI